MTHVKHQDYFCPRCKMEVLGFIPHECDPLICRKCNGKGTWHKELCPRCGGTGRIVFDKEPPTDNLIGVPA